MDLQPHNDQPIVVLKVTELEALIARAVDKSLQKHLSALNIDTPEEELWDRQKTADYYGISLVTLRKWVKCGVLKQVKQGGKVFFKKSSIINNSKTK